jgi:hypothetical protein
MPLFFSGFFLPISKFENHQNNRDTEFTGRKSTGIYFLCLVLSFPSQIFTGPGGMKI